MTSVPAVIKSSSELIGEFADLDDEEKVELGDWLCDELDLDNDKVEMYIEKGFELLLALSGLIKLKEV